MGIQIKNFELNPFMENTYLIWGDSGNCTVIDPGMYERAEKELVKEFISSNNLTVTQLVNTHCHVDHVFGNDFIVNEYNVGLQAPELELPNLNKAPDWCKMYGLSMDPSPQPESFLVEGEMLQMGDLEFEILFVPGHSAGHMAFLNRDEKMLISGDVLFKQSIGRHDLPGGDFNTLESSIKEKLYVLEDDVVVFPGHGPTTTIGHEKVSNAFVRA